MYDLDENGHIKLTPVGGWTSAVLPTDAILIALDLMLTEQALETGERERVQLALTRAQARELAGVLQRAADMPYLPRA